MAIKLKPKLKSLIKDERAVSYLLMIGFLFAIGVIGAAYMFFSDLVDYFIPVYTSTPLAGQTDADTDEGFDLIIMLLKFSLIPILISLMWFVYSMSQKPERNW